MKQLKHTLETYVYSHCNISIYFYEHRYKTLQHIFKTSETLETYVATCAFNVISPCCLRMEARRRVVFTIVELTGGVELAAPMDKDAVEREEDGLLRSGVVEMPAGGAKGPWRGRHGRECGHQGGAGARQSVVAEAARACGGTA
jgi:hypothetical protein